MVAGIKPTRRWVYILSLSLGQYRLHSAILQCTHGTAAYLTQHRGPVFGVLLLMTKPLGEWCSVVQKYGRQQDVAGGFLDDYCC
jgi:hypothetical protein